MATEGQMILKKWTKNDREQIRVTLSQYKGRCMLSVRVWYRDAQGTYRPGRAGINLDVRHLPNISSGLRKARKELERRGLLE